MDLRVDKPSLSNMSDKSTHKPEQEVLHVLRGEKGLFQMYHLPLRIRDVQSTTYSQVKKQFWVHFRRTTSTLVTASPVESVVLLG